MIKAPMRKFSLLICCAIIFFFAISTFAQGMESSTGVSIIVQSFRITSQTEDCVLNEGDNLELRVYTSESPKSYLWEIRNNEEASWQEVSRSSTYEIKDAHLNNPATTPYQYRITVTNDTGETDSGIISILVSNDYEYRKITLRNGNTDMSGYMHDKTRLVVTSLSDSSREAEKLEEELSDNCLPLIICDVSLVNQNNQVVPYFGALQVDFHVGSTYDGQTLKVYHLTDEDIVTYSGEVAEGILSITVNTLSPFMIEVPAEDTCTVTASGGAGGLVTPSGTINVAKGTDKTFTFLPEAGYAIDTLKVDNTGVNFTGNSYTMQDIDQNKTLEVSFRKVSPTDESHKVVADSGAHGQISPSGSLQVRHGSAQTFYFYPEANYELDTVGVNGVNVNVIGNSYTLSAVDADTLVHATFREATTQPPDIYKTIYASSGVNGTISPSGDIRVEYGGGMYYYFIPDKGYEVDKVSVDGTETTVRSNSYHFINVIDNRSIHVTYKESVTPPQPTYHTIKADSGVNGNISPGGAVQVPHGGSQSFNFIPKAGYEVDTVSVDGTTLINPGTSYTFSNVMGNHNIRVTYKRTVTPPPPVRYHTVTANSGVNGNISPRGVVQVFHGGNQSFSFIPNPGYVVDTVTVDGVVTDIIGSSYNFAKVTGNHAIHVTFKKGVVAPVPTLYHTINISAQGNGSVIPSGDIKVADGGSQIFYLRADAGYEVEAIYINEEKQEFVGSQFAVDNITDDMKIKVIFRPNSTLASKDASHCIICKYLGQNISPWCWLIPLLVIILIIVGFIITIIKKRKRQ